MAKPRTKWNSRTFHNRLNDSSLTWDWLHGKEMVSGQYKHLTRSFGHHTWKKELIYYCPDCAEEDRKTYEETYWHRIPQLPGVWHCPVHHVPLRIVWSQERAFDMSYYQ